MITQNKKTNILYWSFTGLFAFFMLGSAIPDLLVMQMAVEGFTEMGLTKALVPFLGVAKLLGVIAILIPGYPKIKEWAYAGLMFDLVGAIYLIACTRKPFQYWGPVFLPLAMGVASYYFYNKKLKYKITP